MARYLIIVLSFVTLTMFQPALAAEFGTKDEAVAMVKRVQEHFKKEGPALTFRPCQTNRQRSFMIAICIRSSMT
jgi:hypothetical protein